MKRELTSLLVAGLTLAASESGRQANRRVEIYVEPVVQG